MTVTEYQLTLGGLDDLEFTTFRTDFGGGLATRQQYVDDFVHHPEHERRICQLLGLKTEEEKLVEAALTSAQAFELLDGAPERPHSTTPDKELEQKFKILFSSAQAPVDFAAWISAAEPIRVQVGVMFVDIDNFKSLNSTFSETVVDETILREFQYLLERCVRHRGCAYRQGGEEFVVILPNHTKAEAAVFAERLRAETEAMAFMVQSEEVRLTVSIGVASFPSDGSTFAEVVREANLAEHEAKASGRNRVVLARTARPA